MFISSNLEHVLGSFTLDDLIPSSEEIIKLALLVPVFGEYKG